MASQIRLDFLGGVGTVTGSRHLLTCDHRRVLVDCGLFQGSRELKDRNWQPLGIDPAKIDAVILTHGHIDHIGYLPRLVKDGFRGPIYCTPATQGVVRVSLPDSAHLQEEEAHYHNKVGSAEHKPALPLYSLKDAEETLKLLQRKPYGTWHEIDKGLVFRFHFAGHILGSAFVEVALPTGETILFSGDVGRYGMPILKDPESIEYADYLLVESTYGDRLHPDKTKVPEELAEVINRTAKRGGVLLIPSFAIGRTQDVLYFLHDLRSKQLIPELPIFVDSPMAASATRLYSDFAEEHDLEMALLMSQHNPFSDQNVHYVQKQPESERLNSLRHPAIIISSSGMCNGGRIVHHLLNRLDDPNTTVLFVGFQAEGTLGRRLVEKETPVRIYGQEMDVRAEIEQIESLSAHADYAEMLDWLGNFKRPPKMTFIVHGEPAASESLRDKVQAKFNWKCTIPAMGDGFEFPQENGAG
jgi:metallo-beta-lactamase family protein